MKYRLWFAALATTVAACNSTNSTEFADTAVSFTANTPTAAPVLLDGGGSAAPNALVLTSVEIVLREIQLERTDVFDCSGAGEDGCETFEVGPVLVSVPVDGSVSTQFSLAIPEGSYDEIEFEIHKVSSGDEQDAAFLAQHPTFADLSIRVRGTFEGTDFVFETDLDVEQELDLSPALVVGPSTESTNITVSVGLDGWFRDGSGQVVNPETGNKGGTNESLIKENIKNSIEAFEDADRDGSDDRA